MDDNRAMVNRTVENLIPCDFILLQSNTHIDKLTVYVYSIKMFVVI